MDLAKAYGSALPVRRKNHSVRWHISGVSKRWRNIALSTNSLWAHIDFRGPWKFRYTSSTNPCGSVRTYDMIQTCLVRSGESPLAVDHRFTFEDDPSVIDLLMACSHRWKSATFTCYSHSCYHFDDLPISCKALLQTQDKVPLLQSVSVDYVGLHFYGIAFSNAPNLHSVKISPYSDILHSEVTGLAKFPWAALTKLCLSSSLVVRTYYMILRQAPSLKALHVTATIRYCPFNPEYPNDNGESWDPTLIVNLSFLRTLHIDGRCTPSAVRGLHLPQLSHLTFVARERDLTTTIAVANLILGLPNTLETLGLACWTWVAWTNILDLLWAATSIQTFLWIEPDALTDAYCHSVLKEATYMEKGGKYILPNLEHLDLGDNVRFLTSVCELIQLRNFSSNSGSPPHSTTPVKSISLRYVHQVGGLREEENMQCLKLLKLWKAQGALKVDLDILYVADDGPPRHYMVMKF